MPATLAPESLRYRPSSWRSTATKAEYFYDYAGQDPINGYDLDGTMINALEATGGRTIPVVMTEPVAGGGTATVWIQSYETSPSSNVLIFKFKLKTATGQAREWQAVQHQGSTPSVSGDLGGFETLWTAVRVASFVAGCVDGGRVGAVAGWPGAAVGCLAVGLAFDIGAEQANRKVKKLHP